MEQQHLSWLHKPVPAPSVKRLTRAVESPGWELLNTLICIANEPPFCRRGSRARSVHTAPSPTGFRNNGVVQERFACRQPWGPGSWGVQGAPPGSGLMLHAMGPGLLAEGSAAAPASLRQGLVTALTPPVGAHVPTRCRAPPWSVNSRNRLLSPLPRPRRCPVSC